MLIADLQLSLTRRIGNDPYFLQGTPPVPVVARCAKHAPAFVAQALASIAIGVLVWPGKGGFRLPNLPQPSVEMEFSIKIVENAAVNRQTPGYIVAEDAAFAAARLLWLHSPLDENGIQLTGSQWQLGDIECEETELTRGGPILYVAAFTAKITASDRERRERSARS